MTIKTFIALTMAFFWFISTEVRADIVKSFSLRTGTLSYDHDGIVGQSGSSSAMFALDWDYFVRMQHSAHFTYRRATDDSGRTLYQAFASGMRYFFLNSGYSTKDTIGNATISRDYNLSIYLESGLTFGRYLIGVFGDSDLYDLSSDFIGFEVGIGISKQLIGNLSADISYLLEQDFAYNSNVAFTATTTMIMFGVAVQYGND